MQPDLGALWRHDWLRRIEEARRVEAAARPSPPPAPPSRLAVWWQRFVDRPRAQLRRPERAAEVPVVEIDLTDGRPIVPDALGTTAAAVRSHAGGSAPDKVGQSANGCVYRFYSS